MAIDSPKPFKRLAQNLKEQAPQTIMHIQAIQKNATINNQIQLLNKMKSQTARISIPLAFYFDLRSCSSSYKRDLQAIPLKSKHQTFSGNFI